MKEVWKDVGECKGYEDFAGLYEVSNMGRVRSLDRWVRCKGNKKRLAKGKVLTPRVGIQGYAYVILSGNQHRKTAKSHRLVALAFLPNPDNLPVVNHKDENKLNNKVSNLEWCTVAYNMRYGTRTKRSAVSHKKPVIQYDKQGNLLNTFKGLIDAGKQFSSINAKDNIRACCSGHTKTAYGYVWKYAEEGDK